MLGFGRDIYESIPHHHFSHWFPVVFFFAKMDETRKRGRHTATAPVELQRFGTTAGSDTLQNMRTGQKKGAANRTLTT